MWQSVPLKDPIFCNQRVFFKRPGFAVHGDQGYIQESFRHISSQRLRALSVGFCLKKRISVDDLTETDGECAQMAKARQPRRVDALWLLEAA